ncbi:MAG: hypothetical protein SVJ22_10490 [Halobacteriota archaeon]|nr:hypothetical protein [Halobacteriota archaeon]
MLKKLSGGIGLLSYIFHIINEERTVRKDYTKVQTERFKDLIDHTYENCDFYRLKYDEAGVRPEDIQSIADISKLPIITKDDIRKNSPVLSKNINTEDHTVFGTSGSTGSPLKIYRQNTILCPYPSGALSRLIKPLLLNMGKLRLTTVFVQGEEAAENLVNQTVESTSDLWGVDTQYLDACDDTINLLQALKSHRPNLLFIYPSVLKNIALFCREMGVTPPQPQIIITTAELLDEHTRRVINGVFNGELISLYGSTEAGVIAVECLKHEGLHVQNGNVVLELLKDGEPVLPGEPGEVVITDLTNKATPIIRYSGLGDMAVLSDKKCSCGNPMPLLKMVNGRKTDSILLPDKRLIHPFNLTLAIEHVPSIAKFQIIQETINKVKVLVVNDIVKNKNNISPFVEGGASRCMIVNNLKSLLGEEVHIVVEEVKDIPRTSDGSHTVVRSLVEEGR